MGTRTRTGAAAPAAALAVAALATAVGVGTAPPAWAPPLLAVARAETTLDGLLVTGFAAANDLHGTWVDATTIDLVDSRPIIALGGCVHPVPARPEHVRCTVVPDPVVEVDVGDGADRVTLHGTGGPWTVAMGDGDDIADTTDATVDGTLVLGNADQDLFISGTSQEAFDGGGHVAGGDTVSYAGRRVPAGPIVVEHMAAGGATADEDVLDEVENVIGTRYADDIQGNNVPNTIDGRAGHDVVDGGFEWSFDDDGDVLSGGKGDDLVLGGPGDDVLDGGPGLDSLDGGDDVDACDVGADGGTAVACEA